MKLKILILYLLVIFSITFMRGTAHGASTITQATKIDTRNTFLRTASESPAIRDSLGMISNKYRNGIISNPDTAIRLVPLVQSSVYKLVYHSDRVDTLKKQIKESIFYITDNQLSKTNDFDSIKHFQIFPDDSLILSINSWDIDLNERFVKWYFNDSLISNQTMRKSMMYWSSQTLLLGLDTISVIIADELSHNNPLILKWIIEKNTYGRPISNIINPAQQFITLARHDTMHLSIFKNEFNYPDSMQAYWYINGHYQHQIDDNVLPFINKENDNRTDTVSVKIYDIRSDSMVFTFDWFMFCRSGKEKTNNFMSEPFERDLYLKGGESIDFYVNNLSDSDSINIVWYHNNIKLADNSPHMNFITNSGSDEHDTVRVHVTDDRNDLLYTTEWIIRIMDDILPVESRNPVTDFSLYPLQDTLSYFSGDTLFFRVKPIISGFTYDWTTNNESYSNKIDSVFAYYLPQDSLFFGIDTVVLTIQDKKANILMRRKWYVSIEEPPSEIREPIELFFYPSNDSIVTIQDSLTFHISHNDTSMQFYYEWFLHQQVLRHNASTLTLYENDISNKMDTLVATVFDIDSIAIDTVSWIISPYGFGTIDTLHQEISFSPLSDSIYIENDSVSFYIAGLNRFNRVLWLRDRDTTMATVDSIYTIATSDIIIDTIEVVVLDSLDNEIASKSWILFNHQDTLMTPTIEFYPDVDTLSVENDSIHFKIEGLSRDNEVHWYVNNVLRDSIDTSEFAFYPDLMAGDSIVISVHVFMNAQDTVVKEWILLNEFEQYFVPEISYYPSGNTTVFINDTLKFRVRASQDSLLAIWYLNEESTHIDTVMRFEYFASQAGLDTIRTVLFTFDSVQVDSNEWIITIQEPESDSTQSPDQYTLEIDSLFFNGDSIFLEIPLDSAYKRNHWFVNNDSVLTDSVRHFIYYPDSLRTMVDTVQVDCEDSEERVIYTHIWYIRKFVTLDTTLATNISYLPAADTTIFYGDSIHCRVEIDTFLTTYQWFLNDELVIGHNDSTFDYYVNPMLNSILNIQVRWTLADSTYRHTWIYELFYHDSLQTLPKIRLLYPVDYAKMTESDNFLWSFDSTGYKMRGDQLFYIEVATDSLFSDIIRIDTCRNDTAMALDNLDMIEDLQYEEIYYWRILSVDSTQQISRNQRICGSFLYISSFASLVQFAANFTADGHILISWQTRNDEYLAGFNLYRSENDNNNFIKINDGLITGYNTYEYEDQQFQVGRTYYYKLQELCNDGRSKDHPEIFIKSPEPQSYALFSNYPNPFNMRTVFRYQIPKESHVTINVYNVLGRKIKTVVDEKRDAGLYTAIWDGHDDDGEPVVSGLYFYQMVANNYRQTRKLTVVR